MISGPVARFSKQGVGRNEIGFRLCYAFNRSCYILDYVMFYRLCLNRMRVSEIRANVYVNPVFGWVFDFRCCVYCVYTDNDNKFIYLKKKKALVQA